MEIKKGGSRSVDVAGWVDASAEFTRRTVFMDILGPSGTGRTTLALTAPGPVALINADEKIDGVVQPFVRDGKRIRVATFGFVVGSGGKQDIANRAQIVWDRTLGWMEDSLNWARSTIFDTGTEGWELCRLANFGELNPQGRVDSNYGPVNAEFRSMWKAFRATHKANLISIHQVKDEYIDRMVNGKLQSSRTGRELRAGFKEFQYMAEVVVRTGRDWNTGQFTVVIEKGWFNAAAEGMKFEGAPDLDNPMSCHFANIMAMITDTDQSEWL